MLNNNIKRIATIEGSYARDTQIFGADPAIIEKEPDWEDKFIDVKYPGLFVGVYEGAGEDEIRIKAAVGLGVHPDVITLTEIEQEAAQIEAVGTDADSLAREGAIFNFKRLWAHIGHYVEVVSYDGDRNVSVECVDCNEALYSVDNPE